MQQLPAQYSCMSVLDGTWNRYKSAVVLALMQPCCSTIPVTPFVEEVQGELVFGIDHPDKQEAIGLKLRDRKIDNVLVGKLAVAQGNTTGGICSGQLPWRVHHDNIELRRSTELLPVVCGYIGVNRNTVRRDLPLAGVEIIDRAESAGLDKGCEPACGATRLCIQ